MPIGFCFIDVLKWGLRLGVAAEASQESERERFIAFCLALVLKSIKS